VTRLKRPFQNAPHPALPSPASKASGKRTQRIFNSFAHNALLTLIATLLGAHLLLAQAPEPAPAPSTQPSAQATTKYPPPKFKAAMADPLLHEDAIFIGNKAAVWTEGPTHMILLEGDASFSIGNFAFRGDKMLIRMDMENPPGLAIKHIAAYIQNAKSLPNKGPITAEGGRLLVTGSTTGKPKLKPSFLTKDPILNDPFVNDGKNRINRYYAELNAPTLPVPPGGPLFTKEMLELRRDRRTEIRQERFTTDLEAITKIANSGAKPPEPITTQPATKPAATTSPDGSAENPDVIIDPETGNPIRLVGDKSILPKGSQLLFVADKYIAQPGDKPGEYNIALLGQARLMYLDRQNKIDATLSADKVVVFIKADAASSVAQRKIDSSKILGVYLEDNVVVSVNDYTIRAPRVYYDNQFNKASILQAVMYAYDVKKQLPIYIRAQELRQESRSQWTANHATLTTSAFYEPHISLAAEKLIFNVDLPEPMPAVDGPASGTGSSPMPGLPGTQAIAQTQPATSPASGDKTLRQTPMQAMGFATGANDQSGPKYTFEAKNSQLKVGQTPVFVWPSLKGDPTTQTPNRGVQVGYSNRRGPLLETSWDVFALTGIDPIDGVNATTNFDYMGRNGPGFGIESDWETSHSYGSFNGYLLAYDTGYDSIGNRNDVDFDGNQRGYLDLKHRELLSAEWEASVEVGYGGGKTFLERFVPDEADASKPFETSLYLKRQKDDSAFTFLTKYDLTNAKQNTQVLQTPGYTVDKLPELGYYRVGTSLLDDHLTYYTENRLSYMRARPGTDSPSDRGFTDPQSLSQFGFLSTTPWDQYYESIGVPTRDIARFDTRHEVAAPFKMGFLDASPYASGRVTAYDSEFRDYLGNNEYNQYRLWGAVGSRFSTKFSRSYENVDSRLLDVHRMRHIAEPNADVFLTGTTVPDGNIPIYDPDVEGLQSSTGFKAGLRNTFQTQRGGNGRWRSVDWLVVNTDYIQQNSAANNNQTLARYFSYQPEYSTGGDHFHSDVLWAISDSLSSTGEITYNMEDDYVSQYRGGLLMQHDASLSTFIDYNKVDRINSDLMGFGFNYRLTPKYHLTYRQTYDFDYGQMRGIELSIVRKLQQFRIVVITRYDTINDELVFGFSFIPEGMAGDRKYVNPFNEAALPQ
jgi:hypothetical protein